MIPKTIHYCWFGHNEKSALMQKCIRSWKTYCPDYEIVEWNEENFDITICDYVREAYGEKKWAFAADYARLWIVYHYGGIYLDTDVEVIRSFDDLLENDAFFGFEDGGGEDDEPVIATGLGFGAEANNPIVERMLKEYDGAHFLLPDGSHDRTTCPVRNTRAIAELMPGGQADGGIIRIKGAALYPSEYFCPLNARGTAMKKTRNTHSIHWYSASWLSSDERVVHDYRVFRGKCRRVFGRRLGGYIASGCYLFLPKKRAVLKRM